MNSSSGSKGPSQHWDRPVWTPLDDYLTQHYSHMRNAEAYFVVQDRLSFSPPIGGTIVLSGRVLCQYGLALDVEKLLDFDRETNYVSTFYYKYQALMGSPPVRVFRYDNVHTYTAEGHPDAFHKHPFDPRTGVESEGPAGWIGLDNWPTLHDVLDELHEWWLEIGQHLTDSGEP